MEICDTDGNVNILTVTNVNWAPELSSNLLSTMSLAKRGIEVFLRKKSRLSEIYFEEEIFGFINIVVSQYIAKQASLSMQIKKNISLQSGRGKTDFDLKLKKNNYNNICLGLTTAPDSIDLLLSCSSQSLHPGDIESSFVSLAKAVKILFSCRLNRSENFMKKCIAKVHKYGVCVFRKLGSIGNKKGAYTTATSK